MPRHVDRPAHAYSPAWATSSYVAAHPSSPSHMCPDETSLLPTTQSGVYHVSRIFELHNTRLPPLDQIQVSGCQRFTVGKTRGSIPGPDTGEGVCIASGAGDVCGSHPRVPQGLTPPARLSCTRSRVAMYGATDASRLKQRQKKAGVLAIAILAIQHSVHLHRLHLHA